MKEVTISSGLYPRASNSLWYTSTTVLKEYYLRNSYARSVHVPRREGSNEANHRWTAPLRDKGNNMIIYVSFNLCPRITTLYNCKWTREHPILMYLSMFGCGTQPAKMQPAGHHTHPNSWLPQWHAMTSSSAQSSQCGLEYHLQPMQGPQQNVA